MKTSLLISTSLFAALVVSCNSGDEEGSQNGSNPAAGTAALEAVLLESAPEGAVTITEARKTPEPGREIVISGKVMGKMHPFVDGRALVTLGDPTRITSCDLNPDDGCETPWDVCCDDPDVIKQSIATIQVVDEEGRPLKEGLKGLGGMKELSSLIVKGTVAEGSNPDNLLVNATGIHIAMVEPTKENPAAEQ